MIGPATEKDATASFRKRVTMRANTSLRILVGDTVIAWGPARVSAANDDQADGRFWRLAAGRCEGLKASRREPTALLTYIS